MKFIAFLIGGIVGAVTWGPMGFLLGALAGVLLVHWLAPAGINKLEELERRVTALEAARGGVVKPEPAPAPAPTPEPVVQTAPRPAPEPLVKTAPRVQPSPPPKPLAQEPLEPNRLWAWLTGGNAMVRIGVVVLFFGVAFLVKYATENVHVPIEARLTGVALGAIVMLVLGWRLRARAGGYGLILQGGGIGVLYLVVFGAFRLWNVLPAELAFVLLVAVAFASAALAVAQDSRALAIAGVSGGFLAPVLASTGQGSHVMLFGFYLVLNAGVFAVAWHKAWRELNIVGFAFTFVIGAMWGEKFYRPEHYASTQPFLIAFFLLYVAIAVLYAMRRAPRLTDYVDSVLVFGVPLTAAGLQFGLVKEIEYGAAWSALAVGAFYVAAAWALWRQHRETLQLLAECFVALGVGFATLAIPLAFDGRWTAASWALEGAAAFWVGVRQRHNLPRYFGLLLQPAAGVAFLGAAPAVLFAPMPVLNSPFFGAITIALAGLFCAGYLWRHRDPQDPVDSTLSCVLLAWGLAWWVGAGWAEIARFAPDKSLVSSLQLLYAALIAVVLVTLRRPLAWPPLATAALALLPVMMFFAIAAQEGGHPFGGLGYVAWPAAFLAWYWVLAQGEGDAAPQLVAPVHCLSLWLLAGLAGWECAWQFDALVGEGRIWSQVGRPLVPALLAAWIATRENTGAWPVGPRLRLYVVYGAAPLLFALWLWVIYINFASSGDPRPLPYVPLVNPLDLAVALAAVVFLLWRRALAKHDLPDALAGILAAAPAWLGATGFLWANGVLLRSLHHWAGVPFRLEAMLRSTLVQASFSVFWSALALGAMLFANRRRSRPLWICGATLLGVVVVKLFVFDLSRISGVERIFSFIGVGLLLLVVGYFVPVPPRAEDKTP